MSEDISTKERVVVKKFDMNMIKAGHCVVILGKNGSGKTTLIKHILKEKSHIKAVNTMHKVYEATVIFDTIEEFGERIIVMDDCVKENKPELHKLFIGKQYSEMLVLFASQTDDIPLVFRNNVDFLFILDNAHLKTIYNKFHIEYMQGAARFQELANSILGDGKHNYMVMDVSNKQFYWWAK
jgi:GTPase SAR1 family protein